MKKWIPILKFCIWRLLVFIGIAFKACLFLPIPLLMIYFSYKVDISGLFQGELAPREVVNLMLESKSVTNYEHMDERQIIDLYAQHLPEERIPDTLAIGSSRVMQLRQKYVGGSYFNAGMSGSAAMDMMNAWYSFERAGKLPKNLILCLDPWIFNGVSAADLNKRADPKLFAEFLEKGLGIESNYEEPDKVKLWKALIDPAYFQGNVKYYLNQQKTGKVETEDGNDIPFQPFIPGTPNPDFGIKYPDGSILYPETFRSWNQDEVLTEAVLQAGTLSAMHGFPHMDPYWTDLFDRFVRHVQGQGVNVVFLLTPYHPWLCLHIHNNPEELTGFLEVEPWLRDYAQKHNIPLFGSYHAGRAGVPETLFFDGIHIKEEAFSLMFPGIQDALNGNRSVYEELYMEKYGEEANTKNALIGTDANCVVPDPEWYGFASVATREDIKKLKEAAKVDAENSSDSAA